jgi:hypothetical protein
MVRVDPAFDADPSTFRDGSVFARFGWGVGQQYGEPQSGG